MSLFRADFGRIHNYIPSFFIPSYVHPLVEISFYSTGFKSSFTMPLRIVEIDDSKSKSSISQKSCNVDASYEQCLAWFFYRLPSFIDPFTEAFLYRQDFLRKNDVPEPLHQFIRGHPVVVCSLHSNWECRGTLTYPISPELLFIVKVTWGFEVPVHSRKGNDELFSESKNSNVKCPLVDESSKWSAKNI